MSKEQELSNLLADNDSLSIICHNNPDPDCLASALALERIADENGVKTTDIYYSGQISHRQTRTFVNLLDINLHSFDLRMALGHDLTAFVDHSIPGINNEIPPDAQIDIVIDHHPADEINARFVHREDSGATATILVGYLHDLEIEPEANLATALLFAIRRETLEFIRGATIHEYVAAEYLHPYVDLDLLGQLLTPPYTPATIDALSDAIDNRTVRSSSLVSHIGTTTERNAIPQAADFLINLEGINTAVIFGVIEDEIQLSARSTSPSVHVGKLLRDTFEGLGNVSGHRDAADGRVSLGLFSDVGDRDTVVDLAAQLVTYRLFHAMDLPE